MIEQEYRGVFPGASPQVRESALEVATVWTAHVSEWLVARSHSASQRLQRWRFRLVSVCARQLALVRSEILVLSIVARHTRTPWYAKLIAALAVGYAFSPLQLIPSFIPVFGLLDDVVVLALGVRIALRLTPHHVLASCREQAAASQLASRELDRRAALAAGALWVAVTALGLIVSIAFLAHGL